MPKLIQKLLGAKSAADLTAALEKAHTDLGAAETALAAAIEAYQAGLVSESQSSLRRMADTKADAVVDVDIAAAKIARLQADLAVAQEAEGEDRRRVAYDRARKLVEAARKRFADYERAAREIRDVLGTIAEADMAVDAVNADLPEGAARLQKAEDIRSVQNRYREVISEETVDLWAAAGDPRYPVPDDMQRRVTVDRVGGRIRGRYSEENFNEGGRELATVRTDGGGILEVVRRRFTKRTILGDQSGRYAMPLASGVSLPALFAGGSPLWEGANYSASRVLTELDKPLVTRPLDPERTPEVEYVLAPKEAFHAAA